MAASQEDDTYVKLETSDCNSWGGSCAGQSDKMSAADITGEQGGPHLKANGSGGNRYNRITWGGGDVNTAPDFVGSEALSWNVKWRTSYNRGQGRS